MKFSCIVIFAALIVASTAMVRVAWSPEARAQSAGQIPCKDPRGCPDIIVDQGKLKQWHVEELTFGDTDCAVAEGCVPGRGTYLLLRFTSSTPNIGAGDLIVGDPRAPENEPFFRFAECHRHLHFEEYADYRLWTQAGYTLWQALRAAHPDALARDLLAARPDIASDMLVGRKQGFCVIDLLPYNTPGAGHLRPGQPKYLSCARNQGISNGYADEYTFLLDCQWIDVTGIKPGKYILEDEVNAERIFAESSYANNSAAIEVVVPDHQGRGGKGTASLAPKRFVPYGAPCSGCTDRALPAAQ